MIFKTKFNLKGELKIMSGINIKIKE